jgi:hypothetical protein
MGQAPHCGQLISTCSCNRSRMFSRTGDGVGRSQIRSHRRCATGFERLNGVISHEGRPWPVHRARFLGCRCSCAGAHHRDCRHQAFAARPSAMPASAPSPPLTALSSALFKPSDIASTGLSQSRFRDRLLDAGVAAIAMERTCAPTPSPCASMMRSLVRRQLPCRYRSREPN